MTALLPKDLEMPKLLSAISGTRLQLEESLRVIDREDGRVCLGRRLDILAVDYMEMIVKEFDRLCANFDLLKRRVGNGYALKQSEDTN